MKILMYLFYREKQEKKEEGVKNLLNMSGNHSVVVLTVLVKARLDDQSGEPFLRGGNLFI